MAYILLDESGDLGFDFSKRRTSRIFLITFLFTERLRPIQKIIRTVHAQLREKHRIRGVLHASSEEKVIRQRVLKQLAAKRCSLMTIYLDKRKVYTRLQDEKDVLYNYVANILLNRVLTKGLIPLDGPVYLIASKRETNKFLNDNFRSYLRDQAGSAYKFDLRVQIKTPAEEKALQAVDFASWAIFRCLEHGDDSFYTLIKERIVEESPLFP